MLYGWMWAPLSSPRRTLLSQLPSTRPQGLLLML